MRKYILSLLFVASIAFIFVFKTDAGNKLVAEIEGRDIFGDTVKVTKVQDGNTVCYLATAKQRSSDILLSGTMISISCVRIK